MKIDLSVDVKRVVALLQDVHVRQVPFAVSKAINATLLDVQASVRTQSASAFTLRRPDFLKRSVKIGNGDFATKTKLVGRVGFQGENVDVFTKFEAGGMKVNVGGGEHFAVPRTGSLVKKNARSIVPTHLRPGALRDSLTLRTFVRRFKGDRSKLGIFAVDRRHEARLGERKRGGKRARQTDTRRARPQLLFTLIRAPRIRPILKFEATAVGAIRANARRHLVDEMRNAIATATKKTVNATRTPG